MKPEWHSTPEQGAWLNVAEAERAALAKPCLGRRIGPIEELRRQVAAREGDALCLKCLAQAPARGSASACSPSACRVG